MRSKPDLKVLDEYGRRKPVPGVKINPMDGRAEPEEKPDHHVKYGSPPGVQLTDGPQPEWLGATRINHDDDECAPSGGREHSSTDDDGRDVAEQEAARKEWLQYYMQTNEFDKVPRKACGASAWAFAHLCSARL